MIAGAACGGRAAGPRWRGHATGAPCYCSPLTARTGAGAITLGHSGRPEPVSWSRQERHTVRARQLPLGKGVLAMALLLFSSYDMRVVSAETVQHWADEAIRAALGHFAACKSTGARWSTASR